MQSAQKIHIAEQDYLEMERALPQKHEYYRGEIYTMGGESFRHTKIASNMHIYIGNFLRKKPYDIFFSDLRVHIPKAQFYSYPDLVIICGEPQYADNQFDTITNHKIIIEILSPSTEYNDKEVKFGLYTFSESFEEYILVHLSKPEIEVYHKVQGSWLYDTNSGIDKELYINKIDCLIPFAEIYNGVIFDNDVIKINRT
ncbi:MAG: Uma2 family endonuclease [Cytophagales bacterium]|nr:Uma2 family endonuclease [Cytophagales bacterium]